MAKKRITGTEPNVSNGAAPARIARGAAASKRTSKPAETNASVEPSPVAAATETPSASSMTAPQNGSSKDSTPSRDEIAELAYSYWVARGCQSGSPEEDWRRAEQELRGRVPA